MIPILACDKLFKLQGATRVSPKVLTGLRGEIELEIREIAKLAKTYAKHANRKTILAQDIELAIRQRKDN